MTGVLPTDVKPGVSRPFFFLSFLHFLLAVAGLWFSCRPGEAPAGGQEPHAVVVWDSVTEAGPLSNDEEEKLSRDFVITQKDFNAVFAAADLPGVEYARRLAGHMERSRPLYLRIGRLGASEQARIIEKAGKIDPSAFQTLEHLRPLIEDLVNTNVEFRSQYIAFRSLFKH
jgi:hypothetical protein